MLVKPTTTSPMAAATRVKRTAAVGALTCALIGVALLLGVRRVETSQNPPSDAKVKKEFYTAKDRLEAMRKALLYSPKAVATADIVAGPEQSPTLFQLHLNDEVTCTFDKPGSEMNGKTPKFSCAITRVVDSDGQVQTLLPEMDEEPVKVKFGADNKEVYAEVVSTRLLWALGYYADAWFPVRVVCQGCPVDPESGSGEKATRTFNQTTIVRKFDGRKMYESGHEEQGWSWKELETANGRPTYEKDALKLLGAFIQHSDNKPEQQRLVCNGVNVDQSTNPFTTTCDDSKMLVQDVGATFGGGGWFTSNDSAKMNFGEWSGKRLWNKVGKTGTPEQDCPVCEAKLRKSLAATDGLSDPIISEEGRRFAAGLMCQLSDAQIADLFKVARVAEMPEHHNSDGSFKPGQDEASIVKQWVDAFKEKREELASGRCRWRNKPADLTAIDNPAGLPAVPNHCTASPF